MRRCDVAVIGAGPAGIAAAITAARAGLSTILIEQNPQPGGTLVKGSIATLCGLYRNAGNVSQLIYDDFTKEFVYDLMKMDQVDAPLKMGRLFVLPFRPHSFQQLASRLLQVEKNVHMLYSTMLIGAAVSRERIDGLVVRSDAQILEIEAGVVIDCSGNAVVSGLARQAVMPGDSSFQTPAVIIPLRNVAGPLNSPARRIQIFRMLQHAVQAGALPAQAATAGFMSSLDADTIVLKVNPGVAFSASGLTREEITRRVHQIAADLIAFLQNNVTEFSHCRLPDEGPRLLDRCSSRPVGRYVLKGTDVLGAAVFPDAVTRGCWPVELWDVQGRQHLRYLPEGKCYDIPAGALQSRDLKNLCMAGRTVSADDDAIASVRVIGCCLATGEAAGRLAGG